MALTVAYFAPTIIAADQVPPVTFSQLFTLTNSLHALPELAEDNPLYVTVQGGRHVQIFPGKIDLDIKWLITWLETICQSYIDLVSQQSGSSDLTVCKPVITNIWTTQQTSTDYQKLHNHVGSNISGNIYVSVPDLDEGSNPTDGQLVISMPQLKDISRFIMQDKWETTVSPGTFVVFPSCLQHATYPWKGTGMRTVVSFEASLVPKDDIDE